MSFDSSLEASTSHENYSTDSSEDRLCRVCSDRSDGAHFGIDSCRACAAFFRRSVVMGKKYVCRQGGNDCDINKSVRCMCRKCRLRKCLEAGMLPESVQSQRDPIVPRSTDLEPLGATTNDSGAGSPSENEVIRNSHSAFQPVQRFSPNRVPLESALSFNMKPPVLPHLLYKINNNYKHLCAVRKSTELSMNMMSIKIMFDDDGPLPGLSLGSSIKTGQLYRAQIPATGEFVNSTFDDFHLLNPDEKWTIFKPFLATVLGMDSAYRTYRMVPPDQYSTKNIVTETTYIDTEHCEDYFEDSSKLTKHESAKLLKQCLAGSRRLKTVTQMADMQIQEEEYAALVALALWNPNIEQTTPNIDRVSKLMRAKIFEQLHLLYRSNNVDNYSMRMGELLCLFSTVLYNVSRLRENLELFNLFDVFKEDSFLYDLFNGV